MVPKNLIKILVVDDAAFMRLVLKDILKNLGYTNIIEASDGLMAIEQYKKFKPDLVTMDVNMPKMDGVQALKQIIKINPMAKIIMVTAVEQRYIVQEAIRNGAKDYIVKPFDRAMVGTVIERVLNTR
ncbi:MULTISPECIES: response regulator [Candidatus Nitrosocaldus]|jgi:two-component system chemotaxis response regulator CheY|uniref:Chemotaxis protein CheY n=1 Tax=Candidatus Nitrosocaldus cavascurensis TaxID=2058097 RepID=A0A2K5ASA2_9ARCH|nr:MULTISPECIES: response regulator [Candidatus Nitrosocaldus]SPC34523.1 Chemotaxis protein CheY [Candidatus Nitrosocaldus cavascurensis]